MKNSKAQWQTEEQARKKKNNEWSRIMSKDLEINFDSCFIIIIVVILTDDDDINNDY